MLSEAIETFKEIVNDANTFTELPIADSHYRHFDNEGCSSQDSNSKADPESRDAFDRVVSRGLPAIQIRHSIHCLDLVGASDLRRERRRRRR